MDFWDMLPMYTSETQDKHAIILQTQIPVEVEGWKRTFTVRTEIKDDIAQTCAFMHQQPGVYQPKRDIYFIAPDTFTRRDALRSHYETVAIIEYEFGFHPTESFEKHCRVYEPTTNNP